MCIVIGVLSTLGKKPLRDELCLISKEARSRFSTVFSDSSRKLEILHRKHRRSIEKSRPYYEAVTAAKKAQTDSQRAAFCARRATSVYDAAKETIEVAETRLRLGEVQLNDAWQEVLTHTRQKMHDAEKEKARGDLEYHRRLSAHTVAQDLAHRLKRKLHQHVGKALAYYEKKAEFELQLQQQKQNIEDLQCAVVASKARYKEALANLERISDEIHEKRRNSSSDNLRMLPGLRRNSEAFEKDIIYPDLDINLDVDRLVQCVIGDGSLNASEDDGDADDNDVDVDSLLSSDSGSSSVSSGSSSESSANRPAAPASYGSERCRDPAADDDGDSAAWSSPLGAGTLERDQAAALPADGGPGGGDDAPALGEESRTDISPAHGAAEPIG